MAPFSTMTAVFDALTAADPERISTESLNPDTVTLPPLLTTITSLLPLTVNATAPDPVAGSPSSSHWPEKEYVPGLVMSTPFAAGLIHCGALETRSWLGSTIVRLLPAPRSIAYWATATAIDARS